MRRYAEYRSSGHLLMGEVPTHWDERRMRFVCRLNPSKSEVAGFPHDTQVSFLPMEAISEEGVLSLSETQSLVDVTEGFTYFRDGDVVVAKITPCFENGKGALCADLMNGIGFGTTELHVLRVRPRVNAKFIFYLTKSHPFRDVGEAMMKGSAGQKRVPEDFVKDYRVALPPREEQDAIVVFLDGRLAEIDRFIANKERLIALLKEQKAAIINRAVTRGLDADAPMKPSGIEWLGEIPAHWEVKPAKYYFREVDERSEQGLEELLSVSHITGVTPRSEKNITMFMAESYEGSKTCKPGDLVINIMWAWMGAAGVSAYSGIVSSAYGVYRQQHDSFDWQYLDYLIRSRPYVAEYTCRSTGITSSRLRMYTEDFFGIPIICPPRLEQEQIIRSIGEESAQLDTAVSKAEREIKLIKEYQTALIADAVTGKIDVRTAVAERVHEEVAV